jgi:Tryptophan halogenase
MANKINRVIIVGGGSAGWMSAATLSNEFPNMEIALVESPDVPIIGVGESTLGTINQYLGLLGLQDKDWMPYCKATYKLAIKFTDFFQKGEEFYYPFGIKDTQNCQQGIMDWFVKRVQKPDTPIEDFYDCFYSCMPFVRKSKIYDNVDGQLPGFSFKNDVAYHMDAVAFGQFLREKYCEPRGVVHVQSNIEKVLLAEDGSVDGLVLDNGDTLSADLYIDCSGFKSMLLEQALGVKFNSYSDILPNNKAWAVQLPYVDKEAEMENVTDCTAINNGWVWNIPLYHRIGTGYVYCNKFISDEDALEEFKQHLMTRLHFPRTRAEVDALKFKNIDIKNGVHEKCWHKNVVGIGLSYGFIEPLESTGLLSVQEILVRLCEVLHNDTINKIHKDNFNYIINGIMKGFQYFVGYHYTLSSRRDTPYWKYVTEEITMDKEMLDISKNYGGSQITEIAVRLLSSHYVSGDFGLGGMPDILVGMHGTPVNPTQMKVLKDILLGRNGSIPEFITPQTEDYWNQKKEYIESLSLDAPSHYAYLKEKIYDGKDEDFKGSNFKNTETK